MGRNPQSNQQIKDERREQILSAALFLFSTKGLSATKMQDVAASAKISQGLIYHYFPSKEAIFTTLIHSAFEKLNAACDMLEALPLSPLEKVQTALERLLEGLVQSKDAAQYYLLIAEATASDAIPEEAKAVILRENRKPYEVMARIFAEGQRTGAFRPDPPEMQALLFWTSITGLSIYRAVHADHFIPPDPKILLRMFV
jgi:AcrR family transcriptional regulator